ncbi:programmed cell death protein 2-like [Anthonomus grandis grandis]|uniref:programmed cell death protein 2-like n=1 Tax=Anthonomus grandis grandis TaxID=2921223 RepID=UPI00216555FC|nr:programmed cell death protein 2-like [Anthonomus grandis grandis]
MAKNNNSVLLGYEDEAINEKHVGQIDFSVNKIGGEPDFYEHDILKSDRVLDCNLCKLPTRLVVQIYAPLENSKDHRTLYLFACINPHCWNKSESWHCLRIQQKNAVSSEPTEAPKMKSFDWCEDAEEWGDSEDEKKMNLDEENCNIIKNNNEKLSEDEESSSFEDSLRSGLVNLSMDDKNANNGAQGGAMARLHPPMATAEIEGDEDGVVSVESPTTPKNNLQALLHGGNNDSDNVPLNTPFVSFFMSVYPEEEESSAQCSVLDNHVKELLSDYQRKDAEFSPFRQEGGMGRGSGAVEDMGTEEYEKSRPLHGDKMFHHFLTKVKANPEQILRYHRKGTPLLLYPLQEPIRRCRYCQGELVFEFQLIPTIIPKLRLECDTADVNRMDFGTVLVYTCESSCWGPQDSWKEECVVVQKEVL